MTQIAISYSNPVRARVRVRVGVRAKARVRVRVFGLKYSWYFLSIYRQFFLFYSFLSMLEELALSCVRYIHLPINHEMQWGSIGR